MITRHVLTIPSTAPGVPDRKVHYRRCGSGPALLMVHQSPRSSKEYEPLMRVWGEHFTCIAPDSPGFGQSDPLPGEPDVADFAAALHVFLNTLGVDQCLAYGFHSGGVTLVSALRQQPTRFHALAIGGYPVWTEQERRTFGERYTPAFEPAPYGEHLTWLWNRVLEQSWFFPWYDVRDETRLSVAHDDPARVQAIVDEMLDAGANYRHGYRAALSAPNEVPPPDATTSPVLISAYRGDPLAAHIDRLGEMPANWMTQKVKTPAEHQQISLDFLIAHAGSDCPPLAEDSNEGFVRVGDGLIHWRGKQGASKLVLHAPAAEMADPDTNALAIDVPGHGLSDDQPDIVAAIEAARIALGSDNIAWPPTPQGDPDRLYPDLTPDRFGTHLLRAWGVARAEAVFAPWYVASAAAALPVDATAISPAAIALRARARLRAGNAARRFHDLLTNREGETV